MPTFRIAIALAAGLLLGPAALAADPPAPPPQETVHPPQAAHPAHPAVHRGACLTKQEQRAAVASRQAISLADAIRSLRAHGRRAEVVRARLCRKGDKLVYLLTLLGRSGRVRGVHIDAVTGDMIAGR